MTTISLRTLPCRASGPDHAVVATLRYRSVVDTLLGVGVRVWVWVWVWACGLGIMQLNAQGNYPADYFRAPVDYRMLLSGTFGELRSNHFHSGIDIKTGGAEGKPIYAVADGYVSRIKVSAFGFGKALYVTHPNGYVSVYAHLANYNKSIGDYVRKEHYRKESFEIEMFPLPGELPVAKGEIVAYSGNSGTSGGPHLHFELREEATQKPVNPLLFGYEVKDFYRPRITSVKIYPEDDASRVNGTNKPLRILVEGWGEEHRLAAGTKPITLSGNISFSIQAYDQQNDTDNKNGPYAIRLFIDDKEVFHARMESFSFDQTRYINSYIDYEELMRNNARMHRTRIDPGNRLGDIYIKAENKGVFHFSDTLAHDIRYEVRDVAGNTGVLAFRVKSVKPGVPQKAETIAHIPFSYHTANVFENAGLKLYAPPGAFYRNFEFRHDTLRKVPGTFAAVHQVHDKYTPVHDFITLAIKPSGLPGTLKDKALIARVKDDGKSFDSAGGNWEEDGFVRTKVREFGRFTVAVDTIPPKISPLSPETLNNLSGQRKIRFRISDDFSGIATYRGTLNGRWILMDYDAKNNLLEYTFDEKLLPGENNFSLEVTDNKNNRSVYKATMIK